MSVGQEQGEPLRNDSGEVVIPYDVDDIARIGLSTAQMQFPVGTPIAEIAASVAQESREGDAEAGHLLDEMGVLSAAIRMANSDTKLEDPELEVSARSVLEVFRNSFHNIDVNRVLQERLADLSLRFSNAVTAHDEVAELLVDRFASELLWSALEEGFDRRVERPDVWGEEDWHNVGSMTPEELKYFHQKKQASNRSKRGWATQANDMHAKQLKQEAVSSGEPFEPNNVPTYTYREWQEIKTAAEAFHEEKPE